MRRVCVNFQNPRETTDNDNRVTREATRGEISRPPHGQESESDSHGGRDGQAGSRYGQHGSGEHFCLSVCLCVE